MCKCNQYRERMNETETEREKFAFFELFAFGLQ